MKEFFRRKKVLAISGALLVVIVVGLVSAFGNGNGTHESVTVVRRDVVDEVRISGTVEADIVSELGFDVSGTVRDVFVSVNDTVSEGQQLVTLTLGTLAAELQSAQADVLIKRAAFQNTSINLETIREKQDTLVANAYSELLSDGLVAEPQSELYEQAAPVITGRYIGEPGTYKLRVIAAAQPGEYELAVFGLETHEPVEVDETGSTPLGDKGLFVSFVDDLSEYRETIWYVTIPNTKSALYAANYSAYQEAIRERERAIQEAEAELRSQEAGGSIAAAELAQAEANVARIQAEISQRILVAPFQGTVTGVHVDPGETVGASTKAVTLISEGGFGVEIDVPEVDSIKVFTGDTASITLDAFGEDVPFTGKVVSVNRTETLVDGVAVYEARLAFDAQDPRIASGMTAEVVITTDKKGNVLAIPARAIQYRENGSAFVTLETAEGVTAEREVALGLRGSDGFVEIVTGLSEGDTVLVPSV